MEYLLLDGVMCRYQIDGDTLTISEIVTTSPDAEKRLLRRLMWRNDINSIVAPSGEISIDTHQRQPVINDIELIACLGSAGKVSEMSLDTGFLHGAQLPGKSTFRPYFIDQNWKKPNRQKYMSALEQYRPRLCTVLDLEKRDQFSEVMDWAHEAAQFAGEIIIIPKVSGIVERIPDIINDKPVRLGYSVPTSYGASDISLIEFQRRPVHLLGGNPDTQMQLTRMLNVKSADFNMFHKMSHRFCKYYAVINGRSMWQNLRDTDGEYGDYAHDEAFRRSVYNLMKAWRDFLSQDLPSLPVPSTSQLRMFE